MSLAGVPPLPLAVRSSLFFFLPFPFFFFSPSSPAPRRATLVQHSLREGMSRNDYLILSSSSFFPQRFSRVDECSFSFLSLPSSSEPPRSGPRFRSGSRSCRFFRPGRKSSNKFPLFSSGNAPLNRIPSLPPPFSPFSSQSYQRAVGSKYLVDRHPFPLLLEGLAVRGRSRIYCFFCAPGPPPLDFFFPSFSFSSRNLRPNTCRQRELIMGF